MLLAVLTKLVESMVAKPREYLCICFLKKKQMFRCEISAWVKFPRIYITGFSRYDDILTLFSALRPSIPSILQFPGGFVWKILL